MIFVIEHDKDHRRQVTIVQGVEDLDTSLYQPLRKIFLCENMDEAIAVHKELIDERLSQPS